MFATPQFTEAAATLRPRLGDLLHWNELQGESKTFVQNFIRQKFVDVTPIYRGLLVLSAGAFEQFVRRLIRDSVVFVNTSAARFDEVPEKLRKENVRRTGQALATVFEPSDYLALDYDDLGKNIGTCLAGAQTFKLNADAFAIYVSTVSPRNLAEVLGRVGFELRWDDFGKSDALRGLFHLKNTKETANRLEEELGAFIANRNRIAHSGGGGLSVTATDVEQVIQLLKLFSQELGSQLKNHLK